LATPTVVTPTPAAITPEPAIAASVIIPAPIAIEEEDSDALAQGVIVVQEYQDMPTAITLTDTENSARLLLWFIAFSPKGSEDVQAIVKEVSIYIKPFPFYLSLPLYLLHCVIEMERNKGEQGFVEFYGAADENGW
jgi:hypothetical protein